MSKKNEREIELEEFRKSLEGLTSKDFDGHTDFQKLTPKQKLIWLSELIEFKHLADKANKKS